MRRRKSRRESKSKEWTNEVRLRCRYCNPQTFPISIYNPPPAPISIHFIHSQLHTIHQLHHKAKKSIIIINGELRYPTISICWADCLEVSDRSPPQGRQLRQCSLHHEAYRQKCSPEHLVWPGPPEVLGPILGTNSVIPHRRVPRRLRVGHRRAFSGPRNLRQEPRAGGDPLPVGHAGRSGLRLPGDPVQERREVRRGGVVQGGGPDLLGGRVGLLGQPKPHPRPEHPGHLGLPGGADGVRGGIPSRRRPARRGPRQGVPRRRLRPVGLSR